MIVRALATWPAGGALLGKVIHKEYSTNIIHEEKLLWMMNALCSMIFHPMVQHIFLANLEK
uniref:Uncharacterized protein n=1 Tax=Coturnix japonica TaxID=93934 RepID=A0A8C2YAJ6_COTJA